MSILFFSFSPSFFTLHLYLPTSVCWDTATPLRQTSQSSDGIIILTLLRSLFLHVLSLSPSFPLFYVFFTLSFFWTFTYIFLILHPLFFLSVLLLLSFFVLHSSFSLYHLPFFSFVYFFISFPPLHLDTLTFPLLFFLSCSPLFPSSLQAVFCHCFSFDPFALIFLSFLTPSFLFLLLPLFSFITLLLSLPDLYFLSPHSLLFHLFSPPSLFVSLIPDQLLVGHSEGGMEGGCCRETVAV